MAHGGGGRLMHQLIEQMFGRRSATDCSIRAARFGVVQRATGKRLALTTDSYVVRPLFFPGGDIGSMAVHGTVNDLAMSGARPLYLSAGFIIEEGLPMETLWRVVSSMQEAAKRCGVQIITGDTKVVDKGKGDGVFINTAGIGVIEHSLNIAPQSVQPGDADTRQRRSGPARHGDHGRARRPANLRARLKVIPPRWRTSSWRCCARELKSIACAT